MNRLERVRHRLSEALNPQHLEVKDESRQHSRGSAFSHLRVVVVADLFKGMPQISRQQKVYSLLSDEFKSGLHALPLRTMTPEEWDQEGRIDTKASPPCGGADHLKK